MELHTQIDIRASAVRVWAVLTAFASYPEWNPFIRSIDGEPVEGARLRVRIEPPGSRAMVFRPNVLRVVPSEELRWRGRLLVPGVFDGEHSFHIEPTGVGVRFVQSEWFSGLLVPLFRKSLDGATRRGFDEMNRALKERAERA
jgi:hypothetical protein